MSNKHFQHEKSWEEHIIYQKLEVFPPKDNTPKHLLLTKDKGETYDLYWIIDTYKSWRLKPKTGWKRIIKRYNIRIDNKKNLDQYDKDVIDHINVTFPLPQ